jgi:hypothetical protein
MEEWLKLSSTDTYENDTSTRVDDKEIKTDMSKLKEDAHCVLKFMASNGLMANASKIVYMVL